MASQPAFVAAVVECLFDTVLLELDGRDLNIDGTNEECLRNHLVNLTAFREVDQRSWGRHERALVNWAAESFAWVAGIRKHCIRWKGLAESTSHGLRLDVKEGASNALAFVELVEDIKTLRGHIETTQKILENIKTIITSSPERRGGLHFGCPGVTDRDRTPLEDGETWQDAPAIRAAQWEHFKGVREYIVSLTSSPPRKEQLRRFQELENLAASCVAPPPRVGDAPEELNVVITTTSMKEVRREVERVLVEIEDGLLRFKVEERARILRNLEHVDGVTSIFAGGPLVWKRRE